jgi:hypothetical protein
MPNKMAPVPRKLKQTEPAVRGTRAEVAEQIRLALKDGGSAEHAAGVQWFFKKT